MWTGLKVTSRNSDRSHGKPHPASPNCVAAEGTLPSAYPKLGPTKAGPFLRERLTAAATCPALGGGRGFGERAQHRANLHMGPLATARGANIALVELWRVSPGAAERGALPGFFMAVAQSPQDRPAGRHGSANAHADAEKRVP
jgi:hypothetical protein